MEGKFGVAVKAIIKNDDGKFLIIKKSDKEDIGANNYDIPGGRIKFGENLYDAVKREVLEETRLEIEIEKVTRVWGFVKDNLHLVGISFLAKAAENQDIRLSEEHNGFQWLSAEDILTGDYAEWIKEEVSATKK